MKKIGFIGLGVMGKNMASNILSAGYELTVYDVIEANVEDMVSKGALAGSSPADVASKSEVVFTSLPNSAIVEAVVLGENGVLSGCEEGTIIVDLSSITPKSIRKIHKICSDKNVEVVDAPVSGGAAGAEKGTLTIMIGGSKEVVEKITHVLSSIGSKINHVGEIGAGDTVKAVNNLLLGANMVAVAEALVLGKKAGLLADTMYDIISKSSGGSYALNAKYDNYISKGNFDPGFMIDLQYKDLQLAIDTAKDLQVPLVTGNMAQQMFEAARAEGFGKEDISAVIKVFEKWADVEVRSEK
ncbi:3-hydroxyisobutyrate dehydrogenase [Dethiosulfatibacter aminovorans DSM 17477]|uniref:3-hydroxyisobutyrate dehydrogenase n=1 Tax=Dethiosulfatibacter aminovorans DSM 17477 TaxID=1121476 RepID=A0A1M6A7Y7_9FIRM|nr:NAD(P)-dependent oxidoreductase [Dethiosulfatibacter aminovorans]SHI32536.1 3-hydroxyisobutyrate dehydrogenase [Dethiosulfatibacter aminovorans DSM 17477]